MIAGPERIIVKRLEKPEEFREALEVQRDAWRAPDYTEAAPPHVLRGIADNGGLVLGAFDRSTGEMVGVSYGFVARSPEGRYYFYSHATGVREKWKYSGAGFALKAAQRREALAMGFDLVRWTFDPLQSLNSRFNYSKLGVVVRTYYRDYYGEMTDPINRGLGTDRVKVEWWIRSKRVEEKIKGRLVPPEPRVFTDLGAEIVLDACGLRPCSPLLDSSSEVVLMGLPWDISRVRDTDPGAAREWRLAVRRVYEEYLARKYIAVEYTVDKASRKGYTVFWHRSLNSILEGEVPWS